MKAYIASGWFTPSQVEALEEILRACRESKINVYSPRDDFMYEPDKCISEYNVFIENMAQILSCDFMIASTEGRDMGTLFECGVAYNEDIPIVYYYKGGGKFNIMLAVSGTAIITSFEKLVQYLQSCYDSCLIKYIPYIGELE